MSDESIRRIVRYRDCDNQGHDWKKVWRRGYWSHLPWWIPRLYKVRKCQRCEVIVLREAE